MENHIASRVSQMTTALSRGERKIADYVMSHWHDVAFSTVEVLAEKVGVSPSSIVRFAKKLGYTGYPDLQQEFIDKAKAGLEPVQRMKLGLDPGDDLTSVMVKTMRRDQENLARMAEMDPALLTKALNMLLAARTVQVMGSRSSYAVATYLGTLLSRVIPGSRVISLNEEQYVESLIQLQPNDLVICVTFPRYSRSTVEVARFAKEEQGARVLAITDGVDSPLCRYADLSLLCPYESSSFHSSYVASMSVAGALIAGVAWARKEATQERLTRAERALLSLDVLVQTRNDRTKSR